MNKKIFSCFCLLSLLVFQSAFSMRDTGKQQGCDEDYALFYAIKKGKIDEVRRLLREKGLGVNERLYMPEQHIRLYNPVFSFFKGAEGYNPLTLALELGNLSMIEYLVKEEGASIEYDPNFDCYCPILGRAICSSDLETIKLLLSTQENKNRLCDSNFTYASVPMLYHACNRCATEKGDPEILKFLLNIVVSKKKLIDYKDEHGYTVLTYVCSRLSWASDLPGLIIANVDLTNRSMFINEQDNYGDTALHYAAERRNFEAIELLVKNGAKINVLNNDGETPLDILRRYKPKDIREAIERGLTIRLLEEKLREEKASQAQASCVPFVSIVGGIALWKQIELFLQRYKSSDEEQGAENVEVYQSKKYADFDEIDLDKYEMSDPLAQFSSLTSDLHTRCKFTPKMTQGCFGGSQAEALVFPGSTVLPHQLHSSGYAFKPALRVVCRKRGLREGLARGAKVLLELARRARY